jgi:cytochrome oxidase assembly protein ShyY1
MIGLGFWQLQRAAEKSALSAAYEERQHRAATTLDALWDKPGEDLAYAAVQLRGQFLAGKYFLLDNQIRQGQFGYEVLGILQLSDGSGNVIVNRGWIAGDAARQSVPVVPSVDGDVDINGYVYVAPGKPYLLQEQQLDSTWPQRIQAVEMDKLVSVVTALAPGRVFPHPVRSNSGEPGALEADWKIVNVSPEKHHAYAVQWFAMALALLVFYALRSSNVWQVITGSTKVDE